MSPTRPIAVVADDPTRFGPVLAELDRRGVPHRRLDPEGLSFDPSAATAPYSVVFVAGVEPTAPLLAYLTHLRRLGVPVVNGFDAVAIAGSPARQLTLLESLDLPGPRSRIVAHPSRAVEAVTGLRFPVVVAPADRPTVGPRFETRADLAAAVADGRLATGAAGGLVIQEAVPARDGATVRAETLGGKYLYAVRGDGPAPGAPPGEIVDAVEEIVHAAGIDVGGVTVVTDARDGRVVYGPLTAAPPGPDPAPGPGFDPVARIADYVIHRSQARWAPVRPPRVKTAGMADWDAAI